MADNISKIYEINGNKKISESTSAIKVPDKTIIYTSNNTSNNTSNTNIKIKNMDKSYTISIHTHKDEEYKSDEIVTSDESLVLNSNFDEYRDINKYDIIYSEDYNLYNLYVLTINCNNIQCVGKRKNPDTSYELVLDDYKGIYIHYHIKDEFYDQKYLIYSQNIKKKKTIHLYNEQPFYPGLSDDQLSYYPIYVICYEHELTITQFLKIYALLIKNIIKYEL
jgi:hypothetical protein